MHFDSIAAAMHMDGHGIYVWSAYAITLVLLFWLLWAPSQQLRERKRWITAEAHRRASSGNVGLESVPESELTVAAEGEPMESRT